jgi:uncharacterized repeat protein (TIGR01451 family)
MPISVRNGWVAVLLVLSSIVSDAVAHGGSTPGGDSRLMTGMSYQNDTSLPLYYLPARQGVGESENGPKNPKLPNHHIDDPDSLVRRSATQPITRMPGVILGFDGISFPGVDCHCAPPDTNGAVGETQYVQIVNNGFEIFDKTTGDSIVGPQNINALWAGFGGVCETHGDGDPVVLYDQIANRWLVSQFAGLGVPTDECVAVSTANDAAGTWHRYAFHLGSDFFDYPHLGVWPDGYYMAMNVFDAAGDAFLGPQAFAFDRNAMLAGQPAVFLTPGITGGPGEDTFLPADLDGTNLPPPGAPNSFVEFPGHGAYKLFHFRADFASPANSSFTLAGSPAAGGFSMLCPDTRACIPQLDGMHENALDGLGDRLMFRLAYRNFGDHESLVGNYTVGAGGVAGVRWFELRDVTAGPVAVFQESTYQPDTNWRWMGSIAMDSAGNLALGYNASSASIHPQLRYAGRLASDPPNQLAEGEAHLFDGTGSQTGSFNRWGDYSSLTVDPVDDCTFWYTGEYVASTGAFAWHTRIGSFRFQECGTPGFMLSATPQDSFVCAGASASYAISADSISGFDKPVALAASGNPSPSTAALVPNVVSALPGSSILTIGNTGGVATGVYPIGIVGTATGAASRARTVNLHVFAAVPVGPSLAGPDDGATGVQLRPAFTWASGDAENYTIEVATDVSFHNIVFKDTVTVTTAIPDVELQSNTRFFWRVTAVNACGAGAVSATFSFTTLKLPGDCTDGVTPEIIYQYGFESGLDGWTIDSGSLNDTWADSTMDAHDGIHSWKAVEWIFDSADQRLVSPPIALPAGQDPLTLSFWHRRRLGTVPQSDECDDAAILEITNNGGSTWNQLVAPELLTDPYDNMVADSPGPGGNPLAGRPAAWCGTKEWTRSRIDLGMFGGNTVQLRYRLGNHAGPVIADGWWYLDDIKVQSCPSGFGVSIDDGRAYAQYGKTLTYVVKLSNSAATPVSGISISNAFPPELDLLSAHWTCSGGAAATCTASGTGALTDNGIVVPAGGSLSYTLTATVSKGLAAGSVTNQVIVSAASENRSASDTDVLVLLRAGFEDGNGADAVLAEPSGESPPDAKGQADQ